MPECMHGESRLVSSRADGAAGQFFRELPSARERVARCHGGRSAPWVPRIDALRQVPATVRFLSVEPLLEDLGEIDLACIHWVIVGGESGKRARPMKEEWVLRRRAGH